MTSLEWIKMNKTNYIEIVTREIEKKGRDCRINQKNNYGFKTSIDKNYGEVDLLMT